MHTSNNTPTYNTVIDYLIANKLTINDLNVEVDYLIEGFLIKQSLTMIFASAGQGKSFLVLALAIKLLDARRINRCIYLDMDNSTMALKARELDKIVESHPNLHYIHHSKIKNSAKNLLETLAKEANIDEKSLNDTLIIFDSIRDFLGGRDMNSDRDVIPMMDNLKRLREAGATIIFLHHTSRSKEANTSQYKGSSSFLDSVDVAYELKSEKTSPRHLEYQLMVHKDRIPVNNTSFSLETEPISLTLKDFTIESLAKNEKHIVVKVKKVLETQVKGINQSQLLTAIGSSSDDKTSRKVLDKHIGTHWLCENNPQQNNSKNYYPINMAA